MTTTEPLSAQSDAGAGAGAQRPRRSALGAVAAVVAIGAVVTAFLVVRGDEPATAAPLAQVEASCADWMGSATASGDPDGQWCTDMFDWMSDRSNGSMMGNMMWQGSDELGRACREWVSDERGDAGAQGPRRCDEMLEWMNGHMSSQGGRWMMQDR